MPSTEGDPGSATDRKVAESKQAPVQIFYADYSFMDETGKWHDPFEYIFTNAVSSIGAALDARERSNSYRKFQVGATSLSISDERQEITSFAAPNSKVAKQATRRCAEIKIIDRAKDSGFNFTAGMFVVGTADHKKIEEVTGKPTPTLHPCVISCLPALDESSVVLSFGADKKLQAESMEAHTARELWEIYDTDELPAERVLYDFSPESFALAHTVYLDLTESVRSSHYKYPVEARKFHEIKTRTQRSEAVVEAIYTAQLER